MRSQAEWKQYIRERVKVDPVTGCWEWQLSQFPTGYGQTGAHETERRAHRLSFLVFRGAMPPGKNLRHRCHNRICCNPKHLLVGTHQDNTNDTKRAGRSLGHQTLTAQQVKKIRRLLTKGPHAQRVIGEMFGVSQVTISRVKLGINHAHV